MAEVQVVVIEEVFDIEASVGDNGVEVVEVVVSATEVIEVVESGPQGLKGDPGAPGIATLGDALVDAGFF